MPWCGAAVDVEVSGKLRQPLRHAKSVGEIDQKTERDERNILHRHQQSCQYRIVDVAEGLDVRLHADDWVWGLGWREEVVHRHPEEIGERFHDLHCGIRSDTIAQLREVRFRHIAASVGEGAPQHYVRHPPFRPSAERVELFGEHASTPVCVRSPTTKEIGNEKCAAVRKCNYISPAIQGDRTMFAVQTYISVNFLRGCSGVSMRWGGCIPISRFV